MADQNNKKFLDQQGLQTLWGLIKNGFQPIRIGTESEYIESIVPKKGEVCLVNTTHQGLRIKIGDGIATFGALDYIEFATSIILRGFYFEDNFYYESTHTHKMDPSIYKLYIDIVNNIIYIYDSTKYVPLNLLPIASEQQPGISKLYNTLGQNTDGSCSQKVVTNELNKKFEVSIDNGTLIFR